jgi:DNA-binding NtrC family response regulator
LAARFYAELAGGDAELPAGFTAMLQARGWPGNVRELRNFIERSVSLGFVDEPPNLLGDVSKSPATIPPAAVEGIVPLHLPLKDARQIWTENFESIYVLSMLKKTGGNLTRAAELAGVNRRFMQRLVARLGLRAKVIAEAGEPDED